MLRGSSFGNLFRVTTFGESHGKALGVVIDGCPPGLAIDMDQISYELRRRRPGQSRLVTSRAEKDEFELVSGVFEGVTTGTPLMMIVFNEDVKSHDYRAIADKFRPGHADFAYWVKYRHRDYRGGGRSSARETVSRVLAGAIARQVLAKIGVQIRGGVVQIGRVRCQRYDWDSVELNEVRSLDPDVVKEMIAEVESARRDLDSVGGIVEVQAQGCLGGWGEPVFERLDAAIAAALMSIPAVKGVEIGRGFELAQMRGSAANDQMSEQGYLSNNHGGVLGGVSSSAPIVARYVLKPTSSIPQPQRTLNQNWEEVEIVTKGRHDPCVAIRSVPIGEAMLAMVLVDLWMQQEARTALRLRMNRDNQQRQDWEWGTDYDI